GDLQTIIPKVAASLRPLAGYGADVEVDLCLKPGLGAYEVVGVTLSDHKSHLLWTQGDRRAIAPPS
ncbi:MAG: hypothetical protein ACXVQ6_09820, partial [Actinomycetota bacterium]